MPHIKPINRGEFPKATEWNAIANAYNAGGIGFSGKPSDGRKNFPRGKNNSGNDRSRFECMAVDGVEIALTTNGQVDLLFDLVDADPDKPPAILLEPIADGLLGNFIVDGLALALVGAASATTDLFAVPDAANDRLEPQAAESAIKLLHAPSVSATTLIPVVLSGGGGTSEFRYFVLDSAITTGSPDTATADLYDPSDESTAMETNVTINLNAEMFRDLGSGDCGTCLKYNGEWYGVNAPWNGGASINGGSP